MRRTVSDQASVLEVNVVDTVQVYQLRYVNIIIDVSHSE